MAKEDRITIMMVGDSLIFRNSLKSLIESKKQFHVISEASDIPETIKIIQGNIPDVLILDSNVFASNGAETFIKDHCAATSTIVLTNSNDAKTHQRFLLCGVDGIVTKQQTAEVLFKAIEQVHISDLWFKRDVMKQTIAYLIKERGELPDNHKLDRCAILTEREKDVLKCVCLGMKNKVIAQALFITETTVRHHLTSIFDKLKVKSRLSLAILAFNEGFVEVPAKNESSTAKYH